MARGDIITRVFDPDAGGSTGAPSLAFATVAEMAAFDTSPLTKGNSAEVHSLGETYLYDPSSALAPSGLRVVAAVPSGNWLRTFTANPRWRDRATWFVGPGGNDEAEGDTQPNRLLTFGELMSRLDGEPYGTTGYDVTITGDLAAEVMTIDMRSLTGVESLYIHGPLTVLFAGVVSGAVQYNDGTSTIGTLTVAGLPVSWTASGLVKKVGIVTAGPRTGTRFIVMQDVGARTARISQPEDGAFGFSSTLGSVQVGDAFEVYDFVQFGSLVSVISSGGESQQVDFQYLEMGAAGVPHSVEFKSGGALLDSCIIHGLDASGGAEPVLYNCLVEDGCRSQHGASTSLFMGMCGAGGLQARALGLLNFVAYVTYGGMTIQGGGVARTSDTSWICWVGTATAASINSGGLLDAVSEGGDARLWGVGVAAASVAFVVHSGGRILYTSNKPPLFAGAATDAIVGGANTTRTFAQLPYISPVDGAAFVNDLSADPYTWQIGAGPTYAETFLAAITSVTWSQTQAAAGAGAPWSMRAQRGFAGSVGGSFTIGGGDGGTLGVNAPGPVICNLGTPVANVSAALRLTVEGGGVVGELIQDAGLRLRMANGANASGGVYIRSTSLLSLETTTASIIAISCNNGNGQQMWLTASDYQHYFNALLTRTDVHRATGACSETWAVGCTSITLTQTARASDAACATFAIVTQAPNAGATGTNRTPGTLLLEVPAAVGGAAEGKIQIGLGGLTGFYFQLGAGVAGAPGLVYEANSTISAASSGAGVNGFGLGIVGGSPATGGNRAKGGDIALGGGDAKGSAGAGQKGGAVTLNGGVGSDNDGAGGDISILSGNAGVTNAAAGALELGTGIPQGTGQKGEIRFFQGGSSGGVSVRVAYFDNAGQFHLGADADTTKTNLRINGASQTTVGAAGPASALPATPTGYFPFFKNGTEFVVPYYAKA